MGGIAYTAKGRSCPRGRQIWGGVVVDEGTEKWKEEEEEEVDRRRRLGATVAARGRIDLIPRHEKCPPV